MAAKMSLLSYCILNESDLEGPDEAVRDTIQEARLEWLREAFEGRKSGFVILAVSEKIGMAKPDENLKHLAQRLFSLYLLGDALPDQVYLDEIFLEVPGPKRMTWKWNVGANYFCANGDKRWWQDHRIPAGMAFSMNSVGHMVRSTIVSQKLGELEALLQSETQGFVTTKVDSLNKALEFAMRTIYLASDAPSGHATELLPLPENPADLPVHPCPVKLPAFLEDRNYCSYQGYYHTDRTIPSEYFDPVVERPKNQPKYDLDFTYLFHDDLGNPDFRTTGKGRQIRAAARAQESRIWKSVAQPTTINKSPLLRAALKKADAKNQGVISKKPSA